MLLHADESAARPRDCRKPPGLAYGEGGKAPGGGDPLPARGAGALCGEAAGDSREDRRRRARTGTTFTGRDETDAVASFLPSADSATFFWMMIELARPEHYEAICAVIAEVDAAHQEQLPDVFCERRGPVRPRELLVQRMQGPESAVLIAVEDAAVVGVLEILMKPPPGRDGLVPRRVALIDTVVVRADHRGRGIGTGLMARAESWAIEQGAVAIELNVWSTNTSAKRLYESLGYATRLVRMERSLERKPSGRGQE